MKIFINENSPARFMNRSCWRYKIPSRTRNLLPAICSPSIRSLARELGISVITTKRAYEELEKQGLIYSEQGKGFFVSEVNQNRLMEGRLREYERRLRDMLGEARELGLSPEDITDIVRMFWDKGGDPK